MMNAADVSTGAEPADAKAVGDYVAPTKPPDEDEEKVENVVKALWKEYSEAHEFDKNARRQYATDRRYAAGTTDLTWAVKANLIGSFIDILCSTLYARDPHVSARKTQQVEESDTAKTGVFSPVPRGPGRAGPQGPAGRGTGHGEDEAVRQAGRGGRFPPLERRPAEK